MQNASKYEESLSRHLRKVIVSKRNVNFIKDYYCFAFWVFES